MRTEFKEIFRILIAATLTLFSVVYCVSGQVDKEGYLIPLGGAVSVGTVKEVLAFSSTQTPYVVLVPQASRDSILKQSIEKSKVLFAKAGVRHLHVVDHLDPINAIDHIKKADVIWISGGYQLNLMEKLKGTGVIEAISNRQKDGIVIAGTSAGASVMSAIMIGKSIQNENKEHFPLLKEGMALWEDVVIDQHFSERNRLGRLKKIIEVLPWKVGLGIDEDTGLVFDYGEKIRVIGKGTVTILTIDNTLDYPLKTKLKILESGDSYKVF